MAELGAGGPGAAALPPPRQWSRPGPSGEGRRAWQSQVGARGTHTAAGPPQRPLPGDGKHPSSPPVQVEASKDDRQNAPRAAATPRTGQPRRGCLGPRSRWLTRWRPVLQMWTSVRRSRPRAAATSTARTPAAPSSAKVPGRGLSVPPAPGVKVEPRERPLSAAREPEAGGRRPLGHVGPVWRPCGSAAHAAAPASVQQRRDRLCRVGAGARRGPVPGSARGLTCCQRCSAWGLPRSPPASRRAPGGLARERGEGRGPAGCSAYTAAPCARAWRWPQLCVRSDTPGRVPVPAQRCARHCIPQRLAGEPGNAGVRKAATAALAHEAPREVPPHRARPRHRFRRVRPSPGNGGRGGVSEGSVGPRGTGEGTARFQAAAPRVSELRFRIPLCSRELGGSAVLIVLPLLFLDCDSACVGCTGKGPGQCKDCIPGYSKESGQCAGQCRASAGGWDLPAGTTA